MESEVLLRHYAEDEDEGQKMTRPDAFIPLEGETEVAVRRGKPVLVRSKTFDPSLLLQIQSDSELKCERRKPQSFQFPRTNSQYHKVFKDVSEEEQLRQSYTCALQKDILYQGRLFVSENWICFHSRVFGKDTKIAIPVSSVSVIKKTKTAILVPNALVISTAHERHVFVSFLSRDTTYKVLMSVCPHLIEESPGVAQSSIRAHLHHHHHHHPAILTADFSADLSDLDAPERQTGQRIEDSSSSDCPEAPEYSKTPSEEFQKRSQVTKRDDELDPHTKQETDSAKNLPYTASADLELMKTLRPVSLSLNTLVLIYLSLVCVLLFSSCYMAFKMVSLEERLTALLSMELPHKRDEHMSVHAGDSAEICSVLSAILLKLEKIHRSLQRLMETVTD
ncbi:GRAM domain-containing protein 2B isoform X2 [Danio aesculapii]|uniref:GRAM domain-containing protein 2B isoform X2 n=1 Tax=Danio aesculapii TaxID=1142201 RepID=UPI0024C02919|nr:GRAM domain-containing protein 2B isoform X2 [Danio aesculapii]